MRIRGRNSSWKQVRIGAPDASLTGASGMSAVTELVDKLGLVEALDGHVPAIKTRARGLSAGELVLAVTCTQLLGHDALVGLDRVRADVAGQELWPVAAPASTTTGALARRFTAAHLVGIEDAIAAVTSRWLRLLPARVRSPLVLRSPTIDLDSTEVEVFGRAKHGVAYNYVGQRAGRPHLASWAEAGLPLAADLLAGDQDVRPRCAGLLARAIACLPAAVCARPRVRADAGYFTAELAWAATGLGADYAVAAKRNSAFWRELAAVPAGAWCPARDMHGAQVAVMDYAPAGWPPDAYTIVRRVRVDAGHISADGRSRRRRTIEANQLALVLGGEADHAWAVSFIVTNLPTTTPADVVAVEHWFRGRTAIEERFREAKLGAGLNHLPSGQAAVNTVWMWSALLAGAISVMLQSLTGLSDDAGTARMHRLRHELLCVPARLIHHARNLTLRLPPGDHPLAEVLSRIRALPDPA
ncbi:IS1380 family transposase [Flexivirga caeni]|nr:IS1380 family transposase [Flexivirga caeni]